MGLHDNTVQEALNRHLGKVIRVTPTIQAAAYDAGDVLFLTTEIPNAVPVKGGTSRLVGINVLDQADQGKDIDIIFMQVSTNLISSLSPGSSGGVAISDADALTAKILGNTNINFSDNFFDLINLRMTTAGGSDNNQYDSPLPILLQAEDDSTSVYFAAKAREAYTAAAIDDLTFTFHIEYR